MFPCVTYSLSISNYSKVFQTILKYLDYITKPDLSNEIHYWLLFKACIV